MPGTVKFKNVTVGRDISYRGHAWSPVIVRNLGRGKYSVTLTNRYNGHYRTIEGNAGDRIK